MKYLPIAFIISIFVFCSCEEKDSFDEDVIAYFKEIALGFEFGNSAEVTRKWENEMRIFVGGNPSSENLRELNRLILEIDLITNSEMKMNRVNDSLESNFYIFFGSGDDYSKITSTSSNFTDANFGLFSVYWDDFYILDSGRMYVDIYRTNEAGQKHLLREELTQSLGLGKDSYLYPESIFQQNFTEVTEYANIDKELIRLLYHPTMKAGLNENEVDVVLRSILSD